MGVPRVGRGARSPASALMRVALLAGGTGGAKLAAGMQELVGRRPGGDRQHRRRHPDPRPARLPRSRPGHLLARRRDRRGARVGHPRRLLHRPRAARAAGAPGWFQLSDRDLATCLYRTHFIAEGGTPDRRAGPDRAGARGAAPRCCRCARSASQTWVLTPAGWMGLQEFLIVERSEPPIEGVEVAGARRGRPDGRGARGARRRPRRS